MLRTTLIMLGLVTGTSAIPPSAVYTAQEAAVELMGSEYGLDIDVIWTPCGDANGYYSAKADRVILCTEWSEYPDAAIFVAAHEAAHAVLEHRLGGGSESEADQLAVLFLIRHDAREQALAAAAWMLENLRSRQDGDTHDDREIRAWMVACMAAGSEDGGPAECRVLYRGLRALWDARLQ